MSENADYSFLEAIEQSIESRGEMLDDGASLEEVVNAELALLGDYATETFYDSELGDLAADYLDGLNVQKEALDLKYSEYQIKWQEGLVARYEALCALYEQYGAFEDDLEFKTTYLAQLETQRECLTAYKAIDADLVAQLDGAYFEYVDYYTSSVAYTNNTEYDFDLIFYFTFYDENGVRIEESVEYVTNIIAGEVCNMSFYWPWDAWSTEYFWEISVY